MWLQDFLLEQATLGPVHRSATNRQADNGVNHGMREEDVRRNSEASEMTLDRYR